jgi:hypothetical protein
LCFAHAGEAKPEVGSPCPLAHEACCANPRNRTGRAVGGVEHKEAS